ncbi:MAG: tetratricopeptide repeat protein [Kofleriaceae bacterium]
MAFNKEKVMDAARKFVDKGKIDKAVKEYLRIVSEDPKDVRVWLKIGDLYAKKGAKQDAIETYQKVARFYHEQGFFQKAVAVYKQILKLDPRLVDVILSLAELYRQLGQMSEAMQHFESVAAHFHREGNTKEALATVKKLVDMDPETIATRIKLAELYSKEGLVEDAAAEFQVACDQLRRQNRQDDFLKVAERLLWHKPDNHALNRELAGLYLRRNDPRRALQKLQACFKADPRDIETLGLLAQAFQALDQKSKTVSVLKELARILIENKQKDKAGEVFRKILEFVPNDPDAREFLGPLAVVPPVPKAAPPRPPTPIPVAAKHAGDVKFKLTSDMPAIPVSNMTGAMPLVDEQSLSGVDFALPEYDDADFSADMEPAPDPRAMSAAGERHAEEISKILAETDVYVKYGLHQKAVDHLRRVFTLDPDNVEAHERLKDILVSQGREQEAEVELLKLAELVAPVDPDRAEAYLQELLAMNGTHTGAFELARRFRLRVARMSSVSSEVDYAGGGVAAIDPDEELELAAGPLIPQRPHGGGASRRDAIDQFEPGDLAGGSPAPALPPQAPASYEFDLDFESSVRGEFDSSPGHQTREMPPDQADALLRADEEDGLIVDRASTWGRLASDPLRAALDRQLDDHELGHDIDSEVAAELANTAHDEMPFDPDDARSFDAGVKEAGQFVTGYEETDLPSIPIGPGAAYADPHGATAGYDPYNGEGGATPTYEAAMNVNDTTTGAEPVEAASTIEDDLDEADFYTSQGMYDEAIETLTALAQRYPNHRLILHKLREVETLRLGGTPDGMDVGADDADLAAGSTDAIDLDDIEEMPAEELDELDGDSELVPKRRPQVMLEKPLDESDADTHYDLGLAYKEMGLHEEAVKAFEKALRAPGREVQCRVMIGMCLREQGNATEAIHQFKAGLHAEPHERERLNLHYEIGVTYEGLGDPSEALYYYEMVVKRDPAFADAGMRAERLRGRSSTRREEEL